MMSIGETVPEWLSRGQEHLAGVESSDSLLILPLIFL